MGAVVGPPVYSQAQLYLVETLSHHLPVPDTIAAQFLLGLAAMYRGLPPPQFRYEEEQPGPHSHVPSVTASLRLSQAPPSRMCAAMKAF